MLPQEENLCISSANTVCFYLFDSICINPSLSLCSQIIVLRFIHSPNKQKIPVLVLGGEPKPFGVASEKPSEVQIHQINTCGVIPGEKVSS